MKVLSVKDVAEVLQTTEQNVYKLVYRGYLPARRRGRRIVFLEDELLAALKEFPMVVDRKATNFYRR